MTDFDSLDIPPALLVRVGKIANVRGWSRDEALTRILERGVAGFENELSGKFDDSDAKALEAAIAAMQDVPDDTGFARIGKLESEAAG